MTRPASLLSIALLACAILGGPVAQAFTPMKRSGFVTPSHATGGAVHRGRVLHMSGAESEAEALREKARQLREEVAAASGTSVEEQVAEKEAAAEEASKVQVNADGTVYDDEVEAYRDPLSDNMRARLMREASTGLDSEKKQTNVILYISIGVAILVLLGGQGILY
eukprot:CAMPEP_0197437566 /NCGR_PEP_ID=MMETSP1175-20131217/4786_1 /TAXON_ID=1003142 /ORGANISM="Triceratium dubium, Strain CCMP147" /LENGTH=165 /DNA_ID=CAMNT_0042967131 /DNA_START=32 /DNA_END=529 /DNA_ORIENTATION=+